MGEKKIWFHGTIRQGLLWAQQRNVFLFFTVFLALQFSCIKGVSDTNGLLFQMKQNLAIQF